MHDTNQRYSKFIDQSVEFLKENLSEIPDVTAWATFMGFSRSHFSARFKLYFEEPPAKKLRTVRYNHLHRAILEYPNETSNSIADRVGLQNEQALYKFLSTHYDTNFTQLREKVIRERQ